MIRRSHFDYRAGPDPGSPSAAGRTRRYFVLMVSLLAFLLVAAVAHANGAMAEFPEGGVVFKHSKEISIVREDLEIGWDHINVHYVFRSSASRPVKSTIGFPTAKVPLDDSPDSGRTDSFKVRLNGKPFKPKSHEYAWFDGANITSKLHDMGVPVIPAPEGHLPKATISKLRQEKLIDVYPDSLYPRWEYQGVYEWTQTFAPGKSEVDITYKPLFGATNAYGYYYPGGEGAAAYCLDDAVKQKLAKFESPLVGPEPFTVGYILKTARNWNGPIGEFRLKIVQKNSFSSFCIPDGLKAAGDGSWEARNFLPDEDLKIVFFYGAPNQ